MKFLNSVSSARSQSDTFKKDPLRSGRYAISLSGDTEPDGQIVPENPKPEITEWPDNKCAFCENKFESTLAKLGTHPICDNCKTNIDKKIFPLWVKMFFGGILVLVVFSLCWNFRFYSAYKNVNRAFVANAEGDGVKAEVFMTQAAEQAPESGDIITFAHYYKSINLLVNDRSKQALDELEYCKNLDESFKVNQLVLSAEMGAAYDTKDYALFLKTAKAALSIDTTSAQSWASVASAYACLYAISSTDSLKQRSLEYINKAKTIDTVSDRSKEYYGLIQYRLDSKQIISRTAFHKQFPNGYPTK
jgi:hypothetical protein